MIHTVTRSQIMQRETLDYEVITKRELSTIEIHRKSSGILLLDVIYVG